LSPFSVPQVLAHSPAEATETASPRPGDVFLFSKIDLWRTGREGI